MLNTNVGSVDRILRILIGAALLLWFFVDQSSSGVWHYAKLIGLVPLITGLSGTCPLYSVLGVNTCPVK